MTKQSITMNLWFLFMLYFSISCTATNSSSQLRFSSFLFFGDSTMDTGNNVYIPSIIQANHLPYGMNLDDHIPTGRFSDGLLVPDLLSSRLELKKLSPPFLDPNLSDDELITGVNFASAGSGFDDDTSIIGNTIPFSEQMNMFKTYIARLKKYVGEEKAIKIINDAIICISSGTNDFILNFYDVPQKKFTISLNDYQDFLLHKLRGFLEEFYSLGARKFVLVNLPPIGCIPLQMTSSIVHVADRHCVEQQNLDAQTYNLKLEKMISKMRRSLHQTTFAIVDSYGAFMRILNNRQRYGFEETGFGCCGTGLVELGPLCNQWSSLCLNVSSFAFFDAVHPTQRVYELITDDIVKNVIPTFLST